MGAPGCGCGGHRPSAGLLWATPLLLLALALCPSRAAGGAKEASSASLVAWLEKQVAYLRAGDERLVRPTPTPRTAEVQKQVRSVGGLRLVASALRGEGSEDGPVVRRLAAEVVHLLTTNNPENRLSLGEAGIAPALVELVHEAAREGADDEAARGGEEAAQAIWILCFSGGDPANAIPGRRNLEEFLKLGAAAALADLVLRSPTPKGKMWAAAALGNLAAAYAGAVESQVSEDVRTQLLGHPGLVQFLVAMLATGPVSPAVDASLWPSQANASVRHSETIMAWAAGQAVKNLALSPQAGPLLDQAGAVEALCRLQGSPDWLEEKKAKAALANLGAPVCDGHAEL